MRHLQAYHTRLLALLLSLLLGVGLYSCDKEEEEMALEVTPGFKLANKVTAEAPLMAPSLVRLVNSSKNGLAYSWEFEGGYQKSDKLKTTTFAGVRPDTLVYELPGEYTIRLKVKTATEEKVIEQKIKVHKPQPKLNYEPILMRVPVTFNATYFQYAGKQATFSWEFEGGQPATSTEANPSVTFAKPGLKTVKLTLNDGVETLVVEQLVDVKGELAKTLYFADLSGKLIYTKMLYTQSDEPHASTGVPSGNYPMKMVINDGMVYVADAGTGPGLLGSGKEGTVFRFKVDGTDRQNMVSGLINSDVPFAPMVYNGMLVYLDRHSNIYGLPLSTVDGAKPAVPLQTNATSGYYNGAAGSIGGIGWGHQNGNIESYNGKLYWSKCANGAGLFVLNADFSTAALNLLPGAPIRSFTIDAAAQRIYMFLNKPASVLGNTLKIGIYSCKMDGTDFKLIADYSTGNIDQTGGDAQLAGVTDIEVDAEGGYLYWGYRAAGNDASKSGVMRYKLDGSKEPEMYVPNVLPYGLAIEHVKR